MGVWNAHGAYAAIVGLVAKGTTWDGGVSTVATLVLYVLKVLAYREVNGLYV